MDSIEISFSWSERPDLNCDPLVTNEAAQFRFVERSVLFGGIRLRLFAFGSLEAVAEPVAGMLHPRQFGRLDVP